MFHVFLKTCLAITSHHSPLFNLYNSYGTHSIDLFCLYWRIFILLFAAAAAAAKSRQSCPTLRPHRQQPNGLLCPWDSPGKNTGVGCSLGLCNLCAFSSHLHSVFNLFHFLWTLCPVYKHMNISSDNKPTNKPDQSVPYLSIHLNCLLVWLSFPLLQECVALPCTIWHPIPLVLMAPLALSSVRCCLLPLFKLWLHPFRLLHWLLSPSSLYILLFPRLIYSQHSLDIFLYFNTWNMLK